MREFSRADRVAEQIRSELATALLREVDDVRLSNVTIMAVKVSDCLQFARIFWRPVSIDEVPERERKRIERAFERATPFLRGYVGQKLRLRVTPEIRFEYDESVDRGRRMDDVIAQVRAADAEIPLDDEEVDD